MNFRKRLFKIGILLIFIIAVAGGSFYFGFQEGVKNPETIVIKGVDDLESGKPSSINFDVFWQAWRIIRDKYVDNEKINDQTLVYGAVSGLLNSLKDPHSVFMPPEDAKKFNDDISGEFSGIGAEIGIRNEQLVIIAPLKDTPAERAGLKPMDKILKIDDKATDGISVDEAIKNIRGPKGVKVILTILRNGWDKPKEISIIRDTIKIPTVDLKMLDLSGAENEEGEIAYLRLYNFYENAPFLFYQNIVKIALANPKGMILDLRNNPGGYLEGSVNIAGWFLEPGQTVVSEKFAAGKKDEFKSYGSGALKNLPIVVLINEGSASASEILAGALRDNRGVKIIGKKSFGKGTVQQLETLSDGSVVKITTAHWLTPKGQIINENGIVPDYEVEIIEEDAKAEKDPQLKKAVEILKQELATSH